MRIILAILLLAPMACKAELPWLKELAGDHELPLPFGVGVDFFTLDQNYTVNSLTFDAPGFVVNDNSLIDVRNEIWHADVKFDAWLFPFLNVFAVLGEVNGDTTVDIGRLGFPLPVNEFAIDYDGFVYGGGFVLAVGGDRWFSTLAATYTEADIDGQFSSDQEAIAVQPRVGLNFGEGRTQAWVGGFYLDAEESHSGIFDIPFLGPVPFAVDLTEEESLNYTLGVKHDFSPSWQMLLELGFGDRDTTLFNFTYRF